MIYDIFPVNNYQGNGSSTVFDFDFYIDNASQLKVYLFDSDGAKYLLEHEIDYSLEGEQNPNGGYITFPLEDSNYSILSEGQKLSLELDIPVSQETQYNNSSLLNLGTLEYSFDYLTRLIQILKRKLSLCVKVEECSNNTPEELIKLINDAHVSTSLDAKEAKSQSFSAQVAAQNAQKYLKHAEEISNDIAIFYDEFRLIGMYKFNLFDTKISDHILEGSKTKGWALQGTYVSGALYPDFYGKCLEEKNNATATETTLADSALTMFVNSNGHQFYNIADKSIVDAFYNICGIADFYGIDEENERVFLPRNKYFQQLTDDVSKVNEIVEAGLPNITGTLSGGYRDTSQYSGAFIKPSTYTDRRGDGANNTLGKASFDASLSNQIYGNSTTVQPPSSLKLLYYCVGNTEVTQAITNVAEVTTSENDTIPLFTGMYFDFKPNNVSWLKAGVQQNNAGIYKTCYDTLVQIVNGVNNYDLKVINKADIVSGVIYDEYWVLDQDNLTFRTPLTIVAKSGIIAEQSTAQLYFKVANGVQNLELLDAGEVLEGLADKLDRGHKEEIISWGIPDYSRGIIPSHPTSSAPFTAPADGIFVDCFYYSTGNISHLYVNGVETEIVMKTGDSNRDNRASVTVPLSKGDVIYWGTGSTNTFGIGFYPFKGSN